jgi:hypothetical protein
VYSVVRVRRDTAWFANALPQLRSFWEKVLRQRQIGIEDLVPKPKKKKKIACKLLVDDEKDDTITNVEPSPPSTFHLQI